MVELKLQVDNQPAMWQLRSDCGDGSRHEGKMRAVMTIAMTMRPDNATAVAIPVETAMAMTMTRAGP